MNESELHKRQKPNPRRVAAGKRNARKRGPMTAAGRERLSQTALSNRPWEHNTGPKTAEGKAKAAENGKRRQKGEISAREQRAELAELRQLMQSMATVRDEIEAAFTLPISGHRTAFE